MKLCRSLLAGIVTLVLLAHVSNCAPIRADYPENFRRATTFGDVAVIAVPVAQAESEHDEFHSTFRVTRIVSQRNGVEIHINDQIIYEWPELNAKLVLMYGEKQPDGRMEWSNLQPITEATVGYILKMAQWPSHKDDAKALRYCVEMIDSPDEAIHFDVYDQINNATLAELKVVKDAMPRERLEFLLVDPKTPPSWAGKYALMLGICGNKDSATLLRKQIIQESTASHYKSEFGYVMLGYMLLDREEGVAVITKHVILNERTSVNGIASVLWAFAALWNETPNPQDRSKLCDSIYPLLDSKDHAWLAIDTLTRMQDWSAHNRLVSIYQVSARYDDPDLVRTTIVDYMKASAQNVVPGIAELPTHAKQAREFLQSIAEKKKATAGT